MKHSLEVYLFRAEIGLPISAIINCDTVWGQYIVLGNQNP